MAKNKMYQKDLGAKINQPQSNISKYINGKIEPDLNTLSNIAEVLDTSVDYLTGRSDLEKPSELADEIIGIFQEQGYLLKENPAKYEVEEVKKILNQAIEFTKIIKKS